MIYPPYEDYERDGRVKKNTKGYYTSRSLLTKQKRIRMSPIYTFSTQTEARMR